MDFSATLRRGKADHVRRLGAVAIQAKVGELRRGMSEDPGIEHDAGLAGPLRHIRDRPLIAEIPDLRRSGGHGDQRRPAASFKASVAPHRAGLASRADRRS